MLEFGATLKNAREAKGLNVLQLSEQTRILPQIIRDLEDERFDKIVAPIYGRGFVKLYAEATGLDPKPLIERFMELYSAETTSASAPHAEIAAEPPPPPPSAAAEPPPVPRHPLQSCSNAISAFDFGRIPWRLIGVLGATIALVALISFALKCLFAYTPDGSDGTSDTATESESAAVSATPAAPAEPNVTTPAKRERTLIKTDELYLD